MILHYLKIAWRNLLKYRMQTAVNVVGIAVGFACFAFANLWMRYEASFDSRYEAADRMYLVYTESAIESGGFSPNVPYPTSTLLKQEFPEVEAACAFTRYPNWELGLEGQPALELPSMQLDSCFMDLFGIRILAGTPDFLYTNGQVALTERTARRLFGTTDVLGRTVTYNDKETTVCAIVNDLPHSNFSFGFICEGSYFRSWQDRWYNGGFEVVVRLAPGVSPQALEEKFRAYAEQTDDRYRKITGRLRLMPLSEVRQAPFNEERLVSFSYLVLFAAAGGLVILCSLFNHLALFLSRMEIRRRELALRRTCGSSGRGLFAMLTTEYSLLVLLSGFLGFVLVELLQPSFQRLSGVEGNVYGESLLYFLLVLALSLVLLLPFVFRYSSLRPDRSRSGRRLKVMVGLQLFISLLAIFCTTICNTPTWAGNAATSPPLPSFIPTMRRTRLWTVSARCLSSAGYSRTIQAFCPKELWPPLPSTGKENRKTLKSKTCVWPVWTIHWPLSMASAWRQANLSNLIAARERLC